MSANAFAKVWVAQADFTVGAVEANANLLLEYASKASAQNARLLVAGELALSGYPPQDLLFRRDFLDHIHKAIELIATKTPLPILFGTPFLQKQKLYNAAVLANRGVAKLVTKKTTLPNYGIFDELRFFTPSNEMPQSFLVEGVGSFSCFICEDIWQPIQQPIKKRKSNIIAINASPFEHQKPAARLTVAKQRVRETNQSLLYVNLFGGQDEVVFDGRSFALNQNQQLVWQAPPWQQTLEPVAKGSSTSSTYPSIPKGFEPAQTYQALVVGLRHYASKSGFSKALLGLSGGIDSAVTAAIAADALGPKNVAALIMPSPYSRHSKLAKGLAAGLGITHNSIAIGSLMEQFHKQFKATFKKPLEGLAAENLQARLRAVLLMAKSNSHGSLLLTTGNKSETAVGYTTLYGDMCGGFSLLKDVYKTQVYELARWRNENFITGFLGEPKRVISKQIIEVAPSAELRPNQLDQDSLPPYEELDQALFHLIEKNAPPATAPNPKLAQQCWQMVLNAEYKRSQAAPGVKVSNSLFGWDRRYPIINHFKM